ncbi:hypothetical protein [Streptomyces chartreusis]|uniref:hypothetical protein n=1 Tax=Streptomyces chartreusis TaxID=1969 RepID=UPI003433257E
MAADITAPSLEPGAKRERTLHCLEAPRFSLRASRASKRYALWRHDLRDAYDTWLRLVEPDGQASTPEGS